MAGKKKIDKKKVSKEDELDNQVKWIIFICVLVAVAFFTWYFLAHRVETINWNNFTFHKATVGKDNGWETNLTIIKNGQAYSIPIFLRNNPLELEKIEVNSGNLYPQATISVTPELFNCSDTILSATVLAQFLSVFGIKSQAAVTTPTEGFSESQVKDCSDAITSTVLLLKKSEDNKTRIYPDEEHGNCIIMETEECNIMKSIERYMIAKISDLTKQKNQTELSNSSNSSEMVASNQTLFNLSNLTQS